MTPHLADDLLQQLRSDGLPRMASQLGLQPAQAEQATAAALPLLLGALGRNARDPAGAQSLFGALSRDHRGLDPGNVLGTVLSGGGAGGGILRHVLGAREPMAARTLGNLGGIGPDRAGALMRMLAPVVLAYLARRMFTPAAAAGPDTPEPSPEGLGQILQGEERELRQRGDTGGLLAILDRDDDGDVDLQDFIARGNSSALGTTTAEMRSPRPLL